MYAIHVAHMFYAHYDILPNFIIISEPRVLPMLSHHEEELEE
jgi:hypothetical protein